MVFKRASQSCHDGWIFEIATTSVECQNRLPYFFDRGDREKVGPSPMTVREEKASLLQE